MNGLGFHDEGWCRALRKIKKQYPEAEVIGMSDENDDQSISRTERADQWEREIIPRMQEAWMASRQIYHAQPDRPYAEVREEIRTRFPSLEKGLPDGQDNEVLGLLTRRETTDRQRGILFMMMDLQVQRDRDLIDTPTLMGTLSQLQQLWQAWAS